MTGSATHTEVFLMDPAPQPTEIEESRRKAALAFGHEVTVSE
jgi:hypothetical protein